MAERWTPIIVRNLLAAAQHSASWPTVPGISRALLDRLETSELTERDRQLKAITDPAGPSVPYVPLHGTRHSARTNSREASALPGTPIGASALSAWSLAPAR